MIEIATIKGDSALLLAELGLERIGQHLKCPFHQDAIGSMRISRGPDGAWLWQCMAGCGGGTIIDAVMLARGLDRRGAILALEQDLGLQLDPSKAARPEPVIDVERAEKLIALGQQTLRDRFDLQEQYMSGKRNLTLETCERFRVGMISEVAFREWPWWKLTAWTIPITNKLGKVVAVKLHNEVRSEKTPKSIWAPLGTEPAADPAKGIKPRHGFATLWPEPERFGHVPELYLCAGELKAIKINQLGRPSTAVTSGESWNTGECIRIKADLTIVVYDDDSAGHKWRDKMLGALDKCKKRARAITLKKNPGRSAESLAGLTQASGNSAEPVKPIAEVNHIGSALEIVRENKGPWLAPMTDQDVAIVAEFDRIDAEKKL